MQQHPPPNSMHGKITQRTTDHFLRIHKSYIVAVNKIEAFTANTIEIQGKELPIGRNFKNAVLNALNYSGPVAGV
jgi:DNA-binding LytR/AlgR family response regulator